MIDLTRRGFNFVKIIDCVIDAAVHFFLELHVPYWKQFHTEIDKYTHSENDRTILTPISMLQFKRQLSYILNHQAKHNNITKNCHYCININNGKTNNQNSDFPTKNNKQVN
jgi:hypothetical protein